MDLSIRSVSTCEIWEDAILCIKFEKFRKFYLFRYKPMISNIIEADTLVNSGDMRDEMFMHNYETGLRKSIFLVARGTGGRRSQTDVMLEKLTACQK